MICEISGNIIEVLVKDLHLFNSVNGVAGEEAVEAAVHGCVVVDIMKPYFVTSALCLQWAGCTDLLAMLKLTSACKSMALLKTCILCKCAHVCGCRRCGMTL